jgi:hypothetical protein
MCGAPVLLIADFAASGVRPRRAEHVPTMLRRRRLTGDNYYRRTGIAVFLRKLRAISAEEGGANRKSSYDLAADGASSTEGRIPNVSV